MVERSRCSDNYTHGLKFFGLTFDAFSLKGVNSEYIRLLYKTYIPYMNR